MFLIAGPCAIEGEQMVLDTAAELQQVCREIGIPLYFKSSFDKANRTSSSSKRGVGMTEGLRILAEVKQRYGLPILTDVHESYQCAPVAEVADVLQIPAFLSRQTDLLQAAARTGRIVNIKKGQFMAPWDMRGAIQKCREVAPAEVRDQKSEIRSQQSAIRPFVIERHVITRPREELYARINARVHNMVKQGLIDEADRAFRLTIGDDYRSLSYADAFARLPNSLRTVGYQELLPYLLGQISMEEAITQIQTNTRHYAKRQLTWWRNR